MTVNYTWQIGPLDVKLSSDGLSKVIYSVHWRLVAELNGVQESAYGSIGLPPPKQDSFTPFESLTEEMVARWVRHELGKDQVESMMRSLAVQLDKSKSSEVTMEPPWSTEC